MKERTKGRRLIALVVAVVLITSGVAGLAVAHGPAASKITSALAIVAGLVFLNMARSKRSA